MTEIVDPFDKLTARERHFLRLVHRGFSSKQIGAQANVSANSVNKVVNGARAKYGNLPRSDLARNLADHEALPESAKRGGVDAVVQPSGQKIAGQKMAIAADAEPASDPVSRNTDAQQAGSNRLPDDMPPALTRPSFGLAGSGRNDLSQLSSSLAMAVIAAAAACAIGALITLYLALDRLAAGH